jgi:aconitate hydratase
MLIYEGDDMKNSFRARSNLAITGRKIAFYDLNALPKAHAQLPLLPFSIKILLENLLRFEDGVNVTKDDILAVFNWSPTQTDDRELAFTPARVILQDFTGVPAIVDLAAMREAVHALGGTPEQINPLSPVDLVIDHSVMVDAFGNANALKINTSMEFSRNEERYTFLRWGQIAFKNFKVVPPGTGIVHQVNLEYLAQVVFTQKQNDEWLVYPDTLVGTDSHTPMVNGLGVLGWGVGGIEAEAAMLGQPITLLIPEVIGFKMTGKLKEGTTATDLVLTVVEILRKKNVVDKFVEFFGDGLDHLPVADRATIANMAPEYGATCGLFPIDAQTLDYLRLTGRHEEQIQLVETYAKAQGFFRFTGAPAARYNDTLTLDLGTVEPSIAGPRRPQDRIPLKQAKQDIQLMLKDQNLTINPQAATSSNLEHGSVVIAAITSCTNTSNPDVMIAAGLLAKKAVALGLKAKPWVKTSLAPGSQVVTDYLNNAGLTSSLDTLGFQLVGYGCTTCIGNSGPLPTEISEKILAQKLSVAAVLSGNRNFEGRIHPEVRQAYLASPPLVVAYALTGTVLFDFAHDAIGEGSDGKPIFLKDIWPTQEEIQIVLQQSLHATLFSKRYADVFRGDEEWRTLAVPEGERFAWSEDSSYIKHPPYFEGITLHPNPIQNINQARVLALLGDSVTTDHISPAGDIAKNSPAGLYLQSLGIEPKDFNSYGSRRGNHEVMVRGTFANIRLRNLLVPGSEGGVTSFHPTGETMSIFDAALQYQALSCPLIIIAGKEYGTGSSRDWAAKGARLLGVRAVIAQSYERIHRSNLIGMGVLPLQFKDGESAQSLGLTGTETFTLRFDELKHQSIISVFVQSELGNERSFEVHVRINTPKELEYYKNDGILHFVLRKLVSKEEIVI